MGLFDKFRVPSERRFALLVAKALRRAGETRAIQFEKDRFRLVIDGQPLPLEAFFREYRAAPRDGRDAILRRAVQSWGIETPQPDAEWSLARLLPVLWPRCAWELAVLHQECDDPRGPWPHRLVGEHLAAGLALEGPGEPRPLSWADLEQAQVEPSAAWEAALENLRRNGASQGEQPLGSFWTRSSRDGSAAAWILLAEEIARLPQISEPVVLAPHRDLLLAAGAENTAALTALAERARSEPASSHALSGFAFRRVKGEWRPWLPEPGHPAYAPLKRLQIETQVRDYVQQKRIFDELGRVADEPVCLASLSAMEDERTGEPKSFTVWPEGLEVWLPQADQVVFFQPDETGERGQVVARASWERVRQTMGDLMGPLDVYPPRYLVRDFPSRQRLQAISPDE